MRLSIGVFSFTGAIVAIAVLIGVSTPGSGKSHTGSQHVVAMSQHAGATNGAASSGNSAAGSGEASSAASSTSSQGGKAAVDPKTPQAQPPQASKGAQRINLELRTTEKLNGEEQPRYVPAGSTAASLKGWTGNITVKRGQPVVLTIINYDDGEAPLPPGFRQFDEVQGGTETVQGGPVTSVPNGKIAHTFTVLGLGVNAPIPVAPSEAHPNTVVITFTPTKDGSFSFQCLAPCGGNDGGFGGAMDTPGWMTGKIIVVG